MSEDGAGIRQITSLQNPQIKAARALHRSRDRRDTGSMLIEGVRLLEEALYAKLEFEQVYYLPALCSDMRSTALLKQMQQQGTALFAVSEAVLQALAQTERPQGLVARLRIPNLPVTLRSGMRLVVADRLQDPGNLGTVARLAAAFACDALLLMPGSTDPWNDKVVRASMGALFRLPCRFLDETELIRFLSAERIPLLAADIGGTEAVWNLDLRGSWALVIGNEGAGLSETLRQAAQIGFRIPMPGLVESLNAATAAAIVLYEAQRQVRNVEPQKNGE